MTIQERARQALEATEIKAAEFVEKQRSVRAAIAVCLAFKYLDLEVTPNYYSGNVHADGLMFTALPKDTAGDGDYGHVLYLARPCDHRYGGERNCNNTAWVGAVTDLAQLANILDNPDNDRFYCETHRTNHSDW